MFPRILAPILFVVLGYLAPDALGQPARKRFTNPPLKEVPIDLEFPVPEKPDPVVFFAAPDLYSDAPLAQVTGLLRRELYRQGVLLAARDELGLIVRDGTLRELPPDDLPLNNQFHVNAKFMVVNKHEISIEVGPPAASRRLWKMAAEQTAPESELPMEALAAAEAFSRGGYVAAMKRAGHRGKANPVDAKATVPDEVEKRLGQMTFTSQYAAVRLLHDTIRTKGESAATLGALSRAYANLGMLTDSQWDSMTWVFKARGLLYAERLRQRDAASPWGLWNRAYAAALAGLHGVALTDLKAAEAARGMTPTPEWATLIDALCRFDSNKLKQLSGDGVFGDTARVFHFLTVESRAGAQRGFDVGMEVMRRIPECYRVHDSVIEMGGVGSNHRNTLAGLRVFSETFPARVSDMPALPDSVAGAIKPDAAEADLVKALLEAGKSRDDRGGLSWAVLARFAQETRLAQVNRRLMFLRYSLAVPADEFFEEAKPLVSDHPLLPYLETYTVDPVRQPAEYQKRVRAVKVPELTWRHAGLLYALQTLGNTERVRYTNIAITHGDELYYDIFRFLRDVTPDRKVSPPWLQRMLVNSPYSPLVRAMLIDNDWAYAKPLAAQWEKEAQHPEVFLALGRRAMAEGRTADAERVLTKAIEVSPDRRTYRLLADVYKAKGDDDKWLATLEGFLKEPDPGLGHAQVRVEIANYFMAKKDFKKAKPYATEAAETWAAWAMLCANRCSEGLEEWDEAERYIRQVSERYENSYYDWYLWCVRTGRGDREAAQQLVEKFFERRGGPKSPNDLVIAGAMHAVNGKREKAAELFRTVHEKARNDSLLLAAAIELDAAGATVQRDRIFAQWPAKSPLDAIFTLLRKSLAKGEKEVPGAEGLEKAVKETPSGNRLYAYYAAGRFLQKRGQDKLAAEYLRRCRTEAINPNTLAPVLASVALRELEKRK